MVVNEAEEKKMDEDTKANMIERRKENTPGKTTKEKETVPGKSIKDKGFKTTQKKEKKDVQSHKETERLLQILLESVVPCYLRRITMLWPISC